MGKGRGGATCSFLLPSATFFIRFPPTTSESSATLNTYYNRKFFLRDAIFEVGFSSFSRKNLARSNYGQPSLPPNHPAINSEAGTVRKCTMGDNIFLRKNRTGVKLTKSIGFCVFP